MGPFRIRHLMIVIACVAAIPLIAPPPVDFVFLDRIASYLVPERTSQAVVGFIIVTACVGVLVVFRTSRAVAGRRKRGLQVSLASVTCLACCSMFSSAVIILMSDFAFLVAYTFVVAHDVAHRSHGGAGLNITGIVVGVVVALVVASVFRRRVSPSDRDDDSV
jgi:hypothetical protein